MSLSDFFDFWVGAGRLGSSWVARMAVVAGKTGMVVGTAAWLSESESTGVAKVGVADESSVGVAVTVKVTVEGRTTKVVLVTTSTARFWTGAPETRRGRRARMKVEEIMTESAPGFWASKGAREGRRGRLEEMRGKETWDTLAEKAHVLYAVYAQEGGSAG